MPLNRTFQALADPTRRALLAQLASAEEMSVSDLARPFAMSLPAVMKHLDVLAEADLVTRTKAGRTVLCRLNAAPMEEAVNWLTHYQIFWTRRLDRLQAFLEEETCPPSPSPSHLQPAPVASSPRRNPASPSGDGSTPRPPGSTPRGRTRRS
ncbi:MAG: ArsR/SmtB family transcription factor [Phreatobacter sp.]|uniref:ArsR/SmtB family transcription factor n=1 Tax=Phreatobacter sp. TaxID=1966341 RepID=UPI004035E5E7